MVDNLEDWKDWVDNTDTDSHRKVYGLNPYKKCRSTNPVIPYADSLGKIIYRISYDGFYIFHPVSSQERATMLCLLFGFRGRGVL